MCDINRKSINSQKYNQKNSQVANDERAKGRLTKLFRKVLYKYDVQNTNDIYIKMYVLMLETHMVGENDITILEPKPKNMINIKNHDIFLSSNKKYKETTIDKKIKNTNISRSHLLNSQL